MTRRFLKICFAFIASILLIQAVGAQTDTAASSPSTPAVTPILPPILGDAVIEVKDTTAAVAAIDSSKIKNKKAKDTTGAWSFTGTSTVNTNQSSFSYWAQGGQTSVSVAMTLNAILTYTNLTTNWQNQIDIGYGLMQQKSFGGWFKTDDQFSWSSMFGKKAAKNLFYSVYFNPTTQFQPGYESAGDSLPISNLFAPLYAESSLGLNYTKNTKFSMFVGLLTIKSTVVNDQRLADQGFYGVTAATYDELGNMLTPGQKYRGEFGGYLNIQYRNPRVVKNLGVQSKIELFSNYKKNPENIDVDWKTVIMIQLNEYIAANVNINLKYDDDVKLGVDLDGDGNIDKYAAKLQFKEVLGVGLNISL